MEDKAAKGDRLFLEAIADEEAGRFDIAITKLKRAIRCGDVWAMHSLAYHYDTAEPAETAKAIRLYRRAARLGNASSANNMSRHFEMAGKKAGYFRWIRRAAELGDEDAVDELKNPAPYMFARGLEEYCSGSAEKGAAIILRAAEWGNRDALERMKTISLKEYVRLRWQRAERPPEIS